MKSKLLVAILFSALVTTVDAQVYRWIDPVTGRLITSPKKPDHLPIKSIDDKSSRQFIHVIIDEESEIVRQKKAEHQAEKERSQKARAEPPPTQRSPVVVQPKSNNPIAQMNKSKAISDIKSELAAKYPGSYHLQKTLLDGNIEAYEYLSRLPATDVNVQILGPLAQKYYPSFHLIKTLYEGNINAYKELNR